LAETTQIWEKEILPRWEARRDDKRTVQLWRAGLPPRVRGRVWALAIGDTLGITDDLFEICLGRARAALQAGGGAAPLGKESTVALIETDLERTFPVLAFFQAGGPLHASLRDVLQAYACFRPDVGYVQGMSFLGAMLLLNMDRTDAFRALCNLLNRRCHRAFYLMDTPTVARYQGVLTLLMQQQLPAVAQWFLELGVGVDLFIYEWFFTLYARSLPLDLATRIWDHYLLAGDV